MYEAQGCSHVFVGQKVPSFSACAVMPDGCMDNAFSLEAYLKDHYGLVFFYPLDFTFVCPSEIIAFSNRVPAFLERQTKIVGISVDSQFTHAAWRATERSKGGLGDIKFPLVSDLTKAISASFGVLVADKGIALRGSFLIDKNMVLRHVLINDLPLGRNADEALRMVDTLIHTEQYGEVCPAGWTKGQEGMKPTQEGVSGYLEKYAETL